LKKNILLLLSFVVISCQFLTPKKTDEKALLKSRMAEINWNEVTSYPSVAVCDSFSSKEAKKKCFFEQITHWFETQLSDEAIPMELHTNDTVSLGVYIHADARISFEIQKKTNSIINTEIIDSILKEKISSFPIVEPAQKEGIPVTTKFNIPIVLTKNQ
jgi:hypothetical protein